MGAILVVRGRNIKTFGDELELDILELQMITKKGLGVYICKFEIDTRYF